MSISLKYSMQKKDFSKLTLLYAEDEEAIRKNALEYLQRIFAQVLEAKNGLQAYEIYQSKKPDIVISDIKMPGMNGLDFVRKIRKTDKTTPVIIVTAHTQTEYLLKAVELRLVKYLIKPVTSVKLKDALMAASEFSGRNNIVKLDEKTYFDTLNKTLTIDNEQIKLSKKELLLLDLLVRNTQRTVTYKEIENYIWYDEGMSMDALRFLVRSLRKKLIEDFVENVSGIGYRCRVF